MPVFVAVSSTKTRCFPSSAGWPVCHSRRACCTSSRACSLACSVFLFDYLDTTGLRLNNVELSVTHNVTPALLSGAAYIYASGQSSRAQKPHDNQVNPGIDHFPGKRTDLYLVGLFQKAGGSAQYAQIVTTPASSTKTEAQILAGIRTRF